MRYKQNLKVVDDKIISYSTHVGTINGNNLIVLSYWSKTTSKHINHVADELDLIKVDINGNILKKNSFNMDMK